MITVRPVGGLGNRMRVIDSAVALGKRLNRPVRVIWERNRDLNCRFDRLFRPSGDFAVMETGYRSDRHPARLSVKFFYGTALGRKLIRLFRRGFFFDTDLQELPENPELIERMRRCRQVRLVTWNRFMPEDSLAEHFVPAAPLQERIDEFARRIGPHTVGVHIRRTDNRKASAQSPLELFAEAMRREIYAEPRADFFIATDSPATEKQLETEFPGKILLRPKELSRESEQGVQDALVDLFCLSRTRKIYGSYWSSFSETAAALSGIELVILRRSEKDD